MPSDQVSRRLRVLDEREIQEAEDTAPTMPAPTSTPAPPPAPGPTPDQEAALRALQTMINTSITMERAKDRKLMGQMNAVMSVASKMLAGRVLLLLSVIGAFVLATMSIQWQSWISVATLSAFCLLIMGPLVWLEMAARSSGGAQN